jgi:molybdopterin converting factor small subunit
MFYGRLADALGPELDLDAPSGCSVGELRSRIAAEHPDAAEAVGNKRVRACIGDTIVLDDRVVAPGERVEFLPPVSGG